MHLLINTPKASFSLTHIATFRRINRSSVQMFGRFSYCFNKRTEVTH